MGAESGSENKYSLNPGAKYKQEPAYKPTCITQWNDKLLMRVSFRNSIIFRPNRTSFSSVHSINTSEVYGLPMAYDEKLANRAREIFARLAPETTEKTMFGGLCFMVDEKMCAGIVKEELMLRLNPESTETVLEMEGCRPMDFTGKSMKGFVYVSEDAVIKNDQLEYWIRLALEYNPLAKATKKKSKPTSGN